MGKPVLEYNAGCLRTRVVEVQDLFAEDVPAQGRGLSGIGVCSRVAIVNKK